MESVTHRFSKLGPDFNLSPEYWISLNTASKLSGGVSFETLVDFIGKMAKPPSDAKYVLDTGNARDGFLEIPVLGDPSNARSSVKKMAQEGDIIISRLRPYLRQVVLLPRGMSGLLDQDRYYCSTEFFVFRPKDERLAGGLVAWLLSEEIQRMMSSAATGGHHPRIGAEMLLSAPVSDQFLDEKYSLRIEHVLLSHLQGQRELNILLRH